MRSGRIPRGKLDCMPVDVQIIVGEPLSRKADYNLLNMRLFNVRCEFPHPDKLLEDLRCKLPKDGWESNRFGGSNGAPFCVDKILWFLHRSGSTPRKANACKVVLTPTRMHVFTSCHTK